MGNTDDVEVDTVDDTDDTQTDDDVAHDIDAFFADDSGVDTETDTDGTDGTDDTDGSDIVDDGSDNDTDGVDETDNDTSDIETNDNDDGISDLSAAILGGTKSQSEGEYNTNSHDEDMQYYVKITLINMWAILGLIVVVNIIFYFCYCRRQSNRNTRKMMFTDNSSDAVGGVSEEENLA